LAVLKGIDFSGLDAQSPDFVHTVTEATKLAFADRDTFYGDPNFVDVPVETLLSDSYNDDRRGLIGGDASLEMRPGDIPGFGGTLPQRLKGETPEGRSNTDLGEPTVVRFEELATAPDGSTVGDTTHFDIIDKDGNMISATPSGGWLQSSPVIPGLGFCLPTRGQMYWLDETSPARLEPGKRPRTTLSPGFVLRDGEPYMAFGTPGGDQQDQWALHFFLRHVHFGHNLQEAIDAPGFQTEHLLSSFYPREIDLGHLAVEARFNQTTIDDLRRRGHQLVVDEDWSLGRMTAASRDRGVLKAGANPRMMQGYAIGR
ncbi:MAG: gamma-glutamyltransferase, partial [Gammaproteobacteria bacterium]|nr:gamma-glutamyltransferase [Gammaproteobacteria bacterium]